MIRLRFVYVIFTGNFIIKENDIGISHTTIEKYINELKKLYIIEDVPSWSTILRSKAVIRTSEIRQFVDPSLAAISLNASPTDLLNDYNTFRLLFESLVIRDLRIYAQAISGSIYSYHDSDGLEVDSIIHLDNGEYACVEIKLGSEKGIIDGETSLLKFVDKLADHAKKPKFLMILTAVGFARRLKSGVLVVPIGLLKP